MPVTAAMAQAPRVFERGLEQLEQEITCEVCRRRFEDPRVLPCCHYFCSKCVDDLAAKAQRAQSPDSSRESAGVTSSIRLSCPTCDKFSLLNGEHTAAGCVAEQFPAVLFVERLKELHSRMAKLERKVEAQCEMCSAAKAEEFCRQCDEFICSECASSHRKMRAKFPDHEIVSLGDLKRRGATRLSLSPPASPKTCPDHEEPLKLFCHDCHELICRDCIVIDHADHHYEFIKKSALLFRGQLKDSLAPLVATQGQILEATKAISDVRSSISSQGSHVADQIERSFAEMITIITREKERLLDDASQAVRSKLAALDEQQKSLQQSASEIQTLLEFTHQNVEIVPDQELLSVQSQLLERVEEKKIEVQAVVLQPSEVANIAVHVYCSPNISEVCKKQARVYLFPIKESSSVHLTVLGEETTHFVFDPNDQAHTLVKPVTAQLQSLVNGSIIEAAVKKTGRGLYEVAYTPQTRGRHKLSLEIEGKKVHGSPFPVFVKIPPSMLGQPLKVVEDLRHPYAATFNKEQDLLVTESGGNRIRVFKTSGRALELKEWADFNVDSPTGLAVDSDGHMYIADLASHSIAKYDGKGTCLKTVGREGSERNMFDHPSGMAVEGERVLVCDRNNCRIQVLDRALNFVQSFGRQGNNNGELQWPYDLVEDKTGGRIYVTDCDNHRIQIFDREGHYVHSFGSRGSEPGKLKRPMGICLGMDGLLYVTEYDNHRVSVFRKDGGHVQSFSMYGRKKGSLFYPVGISMDKDGFVYVCDQGNNRVQVF